MTFLAKIKGAMGLKGTTHEIKPRKPDGKDPAYLAAIHDLPCVICENWGFLQITPTEAHHTICGRHSQRKTPDRQAIPLCRAHHTGAEGIHTQRKWWVENYGPDTDYIAQTQDKIFNSGT